MARELTRRVPARIVAERFGVSERTIKRHFSIPHAEYKALVEARHERIRALRAEGKSYRAIAAELEVSVGTVQYALKRAA